MRLPWTRPPIWLAWVLALVGIGILDLSFGLALSEYEASAREWLLYLGSGLASALAIRWLFEPVRAIARTKRQEFLGQNEVWSR